MKSLTLRSSVALACALSLAACGGGSGNLVLGGSVSGLAKPGLEIQNNGGPALAIDAGATTFAFPQLLHNDEDFEVTIKTQPTGAKCAVNFGKGRTGAFNVVSVAITCATNHYDLTGTVSGLDANGLVLVNGPDRVAVPAGATSVKFAPVDDGSPYGVTVLSQPAGRTCTVTNGVGIMGSAPVSNIQVSCA